MSKPGQSNYSMPRFALSKHAQSNKKLAYAKRPFNVGRFFLAQEWSALRLQVIDFSTNISLALSDDSLKYPDAFLKPVDLGQ